MHSVGITLRSHYDQRCENVRELACNKPFSHFLGFIFLHRLTLFICITISLSPFAPSLLPGSHFQLPFLYWGQHFDNLEHLACPAYIKSRFAVKFLLNIENLVFSVTSAGTIMKNRTTNNCYYYRSPYKVPACIEYQLYLLEFEGKWCAMGNMLWTV